MQEKKFEHLGGNTPIRMDVRIIAKGILKMRTDGKFRGNLFHCLEEFILEIPTLQDRREDIPELAEHIPEKTSGGIVQGRTR